MNEANPKVCILDYGSGNVRSVANLVGTIGADLVVSNAEEEVAAASHLILPGVGAFGRSMERIRERIPLALVQQRVFREKVPFLGICVGMQVLASRGLEFGEHEGLNWIEGTVERLESDGLSLPHIGWNDLQPLQNSWLLEGLDAAPDFYYVHSYALRPADPALVVAETRYGQSFTAVVQRENLCGVQFHPEKSQSAGRRLLSNFLARRA